MTLAKLMTVEPSFCERHMSLLFTRLGNWCVGVGGVMGVAA